MNMTSLNLEPYCSQLFSLHSFFNGLSYSAFKLSSLFDCLFDLLDCVLLFLMPFLFGDGLSSSGVCICNAIFRIFSFLGVHYCALLMIFLIYAQTEVGTA